VLGPDAAVAAVAVNPPPGECSVDVTSTPAGAEVLIDKEVAGTTPAKLMLKCDVEAKLVVRKTRYVSANRSITPTAAGLRIKVALGKTMLSVKRKSLCTWSAVQAVPSVATALPKPHWASATTSM